MTYESCQELFLNASQGILITTLNTQSLVVSKETAESTTFVSTHWGKKVRQRYE